MSGNFQVGDLVECIDVSPNGDTCPWVAAKLAWLRLGGVYRVRTVGLPFDCIHLDGDDCTMLDGWLPHRFRKIDAPDTEIARRIKACKPMKQGVPA